IAVDEVVVENAAILEEGAVLVEVLQRLAKRTAHRRDRLQLFLRQIIEVFVHRRTRIELVLDAVESGHQHRREAEIWIGHRTGETYLDALRLRIGGGGDAAGRRADRKSTRLNSSHQISSYAVFCL